MSARSRVPVLVVALVAVAAAACGVTTEDEPRAMALDDLPQDLLQATPEPPSTNLDDPGAEPSQIFLMNEEGELQAVWRTLQPPVGAETLLGALLDGPDADERAAGLASRLAETRLLGVDGPVDGTITIDLSEDLADLGGNAQVGAVAQVVFTALGLPNVERVRIFVEGERKDMPRGDGGLTSAALTRRDYEELVAQEPTAGADEGG